MSNDQSKTAKSRKILVALDFDHTIIDDNSDTHIATLCPEGDVPKDIQDMFRVKGWTPYMGAIFEHLHKSGVNEVQMKESLCALPFTEGMMELLTYLDKSKFDVIIISDSNSKFIDYILRDANLNHIVQEVYTNPAYFDDTGCLRINFYHTQDWCDLSTENLCKGSVLEDHVKKQEASIQYDHVIYIGDGINDLCPALKLSDKDYICPRKGYSLWKKMKKMGHLDGEVSELEMRAKILEWASATDILQLVKNLERN